ncbi:multidrug and toxin extrusion protein 1-like [Saccostrea echinata]|uniref:multidrug and toxin extrusion protein 1-like n=1 Tax=Saccostrea echinata TaxID=191078 RepID=UPI002A81C66E|nr:multidrug and toxin extrusion protein 1-like [Saccostrea echinata]
MRVKYLFCCTGEVDTYKQEVMELLKMAWPMALTQFLMFLPLFVSQSFCGHLGKESMDGAALASTIINVTGVFVIIGLSTAADALFSQTYGSGNTEEVGVILQKGIWILMLSCLPCWALFLNTGLILQSFGMDNDVSSIGGQFATLSIPNLPGHGLDILLRKFLQAQSIVIPSLLVGIIINMVNAGLHALFIDVIGLETRGAALALTLTYWCSVLFHVLFIICRGYYKTTWKGWSRESLYGWGTFMKLAIPGLFMMCLEFWSFEIITLMGGFLGKADLAANTIIYNVALLMYVIVFGMSGAGGIRVGLYLGTGDTKMAQVASRVALGCGLCFAVLIAVLLASLNNYIPHIFSNDKDVLALASPMMLQLAIFKVTDTIQATGGGLLRGIGLHAFGAIFNFVGYYIIALPISIPLMFATYLRIAGAYWGMIIGSFLNCVIYCVRIFTLDWEEETRKALKRAGVEEADRNTDKIIKSSDEKQPIRMADINLNDGSKCYNSVDGSIQTSAQANKMDNLPSYHQRILCKIITLISFLLILVGGVCIRIFVRV